MISVVVLITAFMAFQARKVEMSYDYVSLIPKKDTAYTDYQRFLKIFGEEGNLIVVGIQDENFFRLDHFSAWEKLGSRLSKVEGVENLLSVSSAYNLNKNTEEKKFQVSEIFPKTISSQEELDSLKNIFLSLPFYRNLLYNPETSTYLLAITVNKD